MKYVPKYLASSMISAHVQNAKKAMKTVKAIPSPKPA